MNKITLSITAALLAVLSVPGQAREYGDSLRYRGEVGATFATGEHTPFWMASDQYGFASTKKNNGWLRAGIFHDMDRSKRFSWGAGVDLGVAYNFETVFIPQQIYAEVKYRCLDAMLGQKEIGDEFIDSELSSGGLTNSRNARPIPQLRIGIFDYADFWGCKGWFAVKGYIGYGIFTDNHWTKNWTGPNSQYTINDYYCTRAIYFRFGDKRQFPLVGELGMKMDSQFGGVRYSAVDADGKREEYRNPNNLKAWIKGLIPMGGSASTLAGEQTNVEGNYLGNWSFALGWYSPDGWSVRAYYEHFFEDHSMMTFDYAWKDGLWGIQAKLPSNPFVTEAVVEYLNTKDQSGPVYYDHTPSLDFQVSGRDSYYNNYIYTSWSNYGQAIGNPLVISPIFNPDGILRFRHNRVEAFNIGLRGNPTPQIDWKVRLATISSWGSYSLATPKVMHDVSFLAKVNWHPQRLKGWEGSLSVAFDNGPLIGKNFGVGISISKTGFIKF